MINVLKLVSGETVIGRVENIKNKVTIVDPLIYEQNVVFTFRAFMPGISQRIVTILDKYVMVQIKEADISEELIGAYEIELEKHDRKSNKVFY